MHIPILPIDGLELIKMKIKKLEIVFIIGLVAFGLTACDQSGNSKKDIPELGLRKDSVAVVISNPKVMVAKADNFLDYDSFVSIIDAKYYQNRDLLTALKNNLNSDVNATQLGFGQELFALNKRNLEIKTRVKNHTKQDLKSWLDFKTATNNDMLELENSIMELAERISR